MTILKLFLSPQVDVPNEVLQAAGKRLKQYFDLICINQRPRKFLSSMFKIDPHAGEVTDVDLVAYITQGSLIINLMDKVYEPGVDHSNMLHGHAGGGTAKMPDGRVLSEVYWAGGLNNLKTSTSDRRGIALANLIFHEWAHNKHTSDPKALSNGEGANGGHVHFFCGGGPLQLGLSYGALAGISNINANIAAMARVLDAQNKQSTCGLYNDDLGY
jgi:hypothetical protein